MAQVFAKVENERGTTNIKPIKKRYAMVNAAVERLSTRLNNLGEFEFDYFNHEVRIAQNQSEELISKFHEEISDDLENITKRLKKARKDDKLKLKKKLQDYSLSSEKLFARLQLLKEPIAKFHNLKFIPFWHFNSCFYNL